MGRSSRPVLTPIYMIPTVAYIPVVASPIIPVVPSSPAYAPFHSPYTPNFTPRRVPNFQTGRDYIRELEMKEAIEKADRCRSITYNSGIGSTASDSLTVHALETDETDSQASVHHGTWSEAPSSVSVTASTRRMIEDLHERFIINGDATSDTKSRSSHNDRSLVSSSRRFKDTESRDGRSTTSGSIATHNSGASRKPRDDDDSDDDKTIRATSRDRERAAHSRRSSRSEASYSSDRSPTRSEFSDELHRRKEAHVSRSAAEKDRAVDEWMDNHSVSGSDVSRRSEKSHRSTASGAIERSHRSSTSKASEHSRNSSISKASERTHRSSATKATESSRHTAASKSSEVSRRSSVTKASESSRHTERLSKTDASCHSSVSHRSETSRRTDRTSDSRRTDRTSESHRTDESRYIARDDKDRRKEDDRKRRK